MEGLLKTNVARAVKLVLEDGSVFKGESFGAERSVCGEVVFNTGMTGYVESFTDSSYAGQILVPTYPLIGNYGVPHGASELEKSVFESDGVQLLGLAVAEASEGFSHRTASHGLNEWLKNAGVPGISGIDTRCLTRILREQGTMLGKICPFEENDIVENPTLPLGKMVQKVSCTEAKTYEAGELKVLLVDCGVKYNIIRHLLKRGVTVKRVPWNAAFSSEVENFDGVLISNGPGDPKNLPSLVAETRACFSKSKPVFGICLGTQIMALAAGADTYKLKYGHRSQNQPCQDLLTRRCVITSQNHGYAVRENSIPQDWDVWFVNINDGTIEGIRHRSRPFFSVQFHPEAAPGPVDTEYLFDEFVREIARNR